MKTSYFGNLTQEQKEEIEASFLAGGRFRERLIELLKSKIEDERRGARRKDAYNSSAWPYMQADAIGYERALMEVISLLV